MKPTITLVLAGLMSLVIVTGLPADEPIFVRWMVDDDPQDQTILEYWSRYEGSALTEEETVDLGTMLFHRGYPKDAVRVFRQVTKDNPKNYEAWFRIGLVEHRDGRLRTAEQAYERCLKLLTGHGWCNFYMGLLQEQTGSPKQALDFYRRAFKFAPELADPDVNPEVLYSQLQLAAQLQRRNRERFTADLPMSFVDPVGVAEVRQTFEPPPPPTAPPEPVPWAAAGETRPEKVIEVKVGEDRPTTTGGSGTPGARGRAVTARPSTSRRPAEPRTRPTPPPAGGGATSGSGAPLPPRVGAVSPEALLLPPGGDPTDLA
jgi:hypothetical protein